MRQLKSVFKFYFVSGVRAKSFILTLGILMLTIIGVALLGQFTKAEVRNFAVVNESQSYLVDDTLLNGMLEDANFKLYDTKELEDLKEQLNDGKLDGIFVVEEAEGKPALKQYYNTFPEGDALSILSNDLKSQQLQQVVSSEDLDPAVLEKLMGPVEIRDEPIKDATKTFGLVYIFNFLMYFFIILYGQSIGTSIASEKNTRVMEIMLSNVKPLVLLYGKMMATFALAFVQILGMGIALGICKVTGLIESKSLSLFGNEILDLSLLSPSVVLLFILYFSLGFILFGLLYAAAGSMVSRIEDLNASATPIILLIIGGFFISMQSLTNPTGTLVEICTYIPFFSPIVTFSRIAAGVAPIGEIVGTIAILLITIVILGNFVKRIYVNGVMIYSEKFTWKQLGHFVKKH